MRHLRTGEHEDLALFFWKAQLAAGEAGRFELALGHVQLAVHDAGRLLQRANSN